MKYSDMMGLEKLRTVVVDVFEDLCLERRLLFVKLWISTLVLHYGELLSNTKSVI